MSSKLATRIGLYIGQYLPPWMGYGLARIVANYASRWRPQNYWTVWANLRQVLGPQVDDVTLHERARQVFFHAGQAYYDFYHTIGKAPEKFAQVVQIPTSLIDLLKTETGQGRGVLLLGLHISSLDLAMIAIGAHGVPIHALFLADPGPGFQLQNDLRARAGIEVTPISPESLRLAIRRLKSGWIVSVATDRPDPGEPTLTEFFGQPAHLPVGPVRMALLTGAAVVVGSCHHDPEAGYVGRFTGPLEMVRTGDRQQDIISNARRVAIVLEEHVREHPEQWLMFHRVWPELPPSSASETGSDLPRS